MIRVWSEVYHHSTWKPYFLSYPFLFTMCLGISPVTRIPIHLTSTGKLICYLSRVGIQLKQGNSVHWSKGGKLMSRSKGFSPLTTEGSRGTDLATCHDFVIVMWYEPYSIISMYINKCTYSSVLIVKYIRGVVMQKGLREEIMLHVTNSVYKTEGAYLKLPVTMY